MEAGMIRGTWFDPNHRFRALDANGNEVKHICYAASREELERRLEEDDLTLDWIEPYDFSDWKARAKKAREKAIKDYNDGKRPIDFDREIWSELKWHLFELFHRKCAYCESKTLLVSSGDVEHYRPKAKVEEDENHPGYYWLAYSETNLLPACERCNRARGKMNRFPVEGTRAYDPNSGLDKEEPLLLNPYDQLTNLYKHLEFSDHGMARALNQSERGKTSWSCYNLNRPGLPQERRNAIAKVQRQWSLFTGEIVSREDVRGLLSKDLAKGVREYTAAQMWELDRIMKSEGLGGLDAVMAGA
jgi:5-methylcytosine-specific restriction endonuclease McrA